MSMPPIDTWTEIVDRLMYVAHARVEETWRGQLFAASAFVIVSHDVYRDRGRVMARQRLEQLLAARHFIPDGGVHRHNMPPVGKVRDLGR
jgi:hypothetical protein